MAAQISEAFGLVVKFRLRPDGGAGFDQLTAETVPLIHKHEAGTLLYLCQRVDGKPAERVFFELYRDRAAFESHEAQPHTKHFLSERAQYLEGFDVDFLTPTEIAGAWIPAGRD